MVLGSTHPLTDINTRNTLYLQNFGTNVKEYMLILSRSFQNSRRVLSSFVKNINPFIRSFLIMSYFTTRVTIRVRELQALETVWSFVQILQIYIFIVCIYITLIPPKFNVCLFVYTKFSTQFGYSKVVRETYYEILDYMKFTEIFADKCIKSF